jgi:heme A synthase
MSTHFHRSRMPPPRPTRRKEVVRTMEFLNFVLIAWIAWLVWRRPEREGLAFGLLVLSCVLMTLLFLVGIHTSFVPGVNL